MVWFCVAMMPFCIRVLTTAATRSAMRLASSCTVIASGTCTSRTTFSRSPEWLAMRRFSRSWRRFIAASERWRPSSSVALAMVSLPERRRSSSPLSAGALLLDDGAACRRPSSGRSGGRPRRGRPRPARRRGRPARRGRARRRPAPWPSAAARAASSACSAAAAAARCSAISRSRACALGGLLLGAQPRELGLAGLGGLALLLAALGLLRLGGLDRLQAALELGVARGSASRRGGAVGASRRARRASAPGCACACARP